MTTTNHHDDPEVIFETDIDWEAERELADDWAEHQRRELEDSWRMDITEQLWRDR